MGLRYRIHRADLPGRPDVVFVAARVAVFVDGDFWHGRDWRSRRARLARGANAPYWLAKIAANRTRDRRSTAALQRHGWTVIRVWERDVLADPERIANAVARSVRGRARTEPAAGAAL